jgi:hypothetical protein
MIKMKVISLSYACGRGLSEVKEVKVGVDDVTLITEHLSQEGSDRLWFDIYVKGRLDQRVFFPVRAEYEF